MKYYSQNLLGLYWLNPCTDGNQDSLAASHQYIEEKKDDQGKQHNLN